MVVCQERRRKLTSEAQKAVTAALREAAVQDGSDVEVQHGDVPCLPVAVGRISHQIKRNQTRVAELFKNFQGSL